MASDAGNESAPPPHLVSPALRRRLQQCYEHGSKLLRQEQYDADYAHTMFLECVVKDPANVVYLEAFFENLHRKYNHNKRGALLGFGGKSTFKKALAKQDWARVLELGPEVLKNNPWDVPTLRGMAQACQAFEYNESELRYLRNALEAKPKDVDVNRHCARSLARMGQFDQAIGCWHRIDELRGGDLEAQEQISELQVEKTKTRQEGGKRRRGVVRRAAADEQAAEQPSEPDESTARREIPLTPRQQLEQEIVNCPTDLDSYFRLGELHVEEGRLGEAVHLLNKALAASGGDLRVHERLEDVEILRKRQQVAVAENRAASDPTQQAQTLAAQLRSDLDRFELEVFSRRAQRYPNDLEMKFQLGLRLKRVGNLGEAIKTFEFSAVLPERQAGSTLEIGECLQRRKQYGKALEYYQRARRQAESSEHLELRKLALYRASLLAIGLGNSKSAEEMLRELLELDADYKDAASRLDKITRMRHKEQSAESPDPYS